MHQLEDNLKAADLKLSATEIHQLGTLTTPPSLYPGWMQAMGWDAKVKAVFDLDSKNQ